MSKNFTRPKQFDFYDYKDLIANSFPDLRYEIKDIDQSIHELTYLLAKSAKNAIVENNIEYLDNLFSKISDLISISNLDSEILNSFYISFLTKEDFDNTENGDEIFKRIPKTIKSIIMKAI